MSAAVEDWMPRPARHASTAAARLPSTASALTPWTVNESGGRRQTKNPMTAAVATSTTAKAALVRLAPDISRASKPRPDLLYVPHHEAAHGGHGVVGGGENRRLAPQQPPVLAPQHLPQVI